jgi:hypothetical protein
MTLTPEPNTSAEPVGDGGMRAAVARIIAPKAWALLDHEVEARMKGQMGMSIAEISEIVGPSLETADAILAALRPTLTDHTTATRLLAEKDAELVRGEAHRNELYDKVVSQRTEVGALQARALAAEAEVTRWQSAYNAANDTAVILGDQAAKAEAEVERLTAELKAATGYMRNAMIDLETGATKATALRTIKGGIARAERALTPDQ